MAFLDEYTFDQINDIISQSHNTAEVLIKMGRSANSGSNRMVMSQYIKDNGIDISHFDESAQNRTPADIFIENSTVTQNVMRKYYKRGEYSEYKCAICGQEPFWNGKPLVLTLDHINGISNDHRLENLRWVCPNCDRQLPTYGSKRLKKVHFCGKCGKQISAKTKTGLCKECYTNDVLKNPSSDFNLKKHKHGKYSQSRSHGECLICGKSISKTAKYCPECYAKSKQKANRPTALDLAKMVKDLGFTQVGKTFGVVDTAIKKWCKDYGIPHTKKELIAWYDKQMGIIPEEKQKKKSIDEIVRPVKQIDKETGHCLKVFSSQSDALRSFGVTKHNNHISQVCRGLRKSAYGYYWQYADTENT